jgi:hypothetical protein
LLIVPRLPCQGEHLGLPHLAGLRFLEKVDPTHDLTKLATRLVCAYARLGEPPWKD